MGGTDDERSLPITDDDVRAIVRLVGEVAGLDAPVADRRRALIGGLARLVDADVWVWVHSAGTDSGTGRQLAVMGVIDGGWRDDAERTSVYHANSQPEVNAALMAGHRPDRPRTFCFDASAPGWGDGGVYERFIAPTGLTRLLFCVHPLPGGRISGIGLHRRSNRSPYTPRETAIASVVVGQVDWLHHHAPPPAASDGELLRLTPRLRETLLHLLGGDSRKQIARKLGLSEHTVGDHIKQLHRRLGVSSRGELMSKFLPS